MCIVSFYNFSALSLLCKLLRKRESVSNDEINGIQHSRIYTGVLWADNQKETKLPLYYPDFQLVIISLWELYYISFIEQWSNGKFALSFPFLNLKVHRYICKYHYLKMGSTLGIKRLNTVFITLK